MAYINPQQILPGTVFFTITPSDTVPLARLARGLNVSISGSVVVVDAEGTTSTLYIAAGIVFPVTVSQVMATGTSAGVIVGIL